MSTMLGKRWKDAATVIIAAREPSKKINSFINVAAERDMFDYRILTLKRSSKSSFMPDSYVFPGGKSEAADNWQEWLELFSEFGFNIRKFVQQSTECSNGADGNIFNSNSAEEIHKLISLRITAIRETFEECGILLCKPEKAKQSINWCSYVTGNEFQEWRSKIRQNPAEFVNACKYFRCYPDIWSLKKWSNWLTPATFSKRFNAAFFLTTLNRIPPTCADDTEVTDVQWLSPQQMLRMAGAGDIVLPIPQLYEAARVHNFTSVEGLQEFAQQRDTLPAQQWLSVHVACNDGMLFLLPGDDLYPEHEDLEKRQTVETLQGTMRELRARTTWLNRLEAHGKQWHVVCNLTSSPNTGCAYPSLSARAKL